MTERDLNLTVPVAAVQLKNASTDALPTIRIADVRFVAAAAP